MIDIKYKGNIEKSGITGFSIAEARKMYKAQFGIPDKATAVLNGKKITRIGEIITVLDDEDILVFKATGVNRMAMLAGAVLLALAVTGGVFASGFMNSTSTLSATMAQSDFASVSANTTSAPLWVARGMQKSPTGSGTLFDIDTLTSAYTGDFAVTIMLTNTNEIIDVYRNLTLILEVRDSSNNLVDINDDGIADSKDCTLLTLDNSRVSFNIEQTTPDVYTVYLKGGYFNCNVQHPGWASGGTPMLYCELTQR